mgnify:CR=1 FL=1
MKEFDLNLVSLPPVFRTEIDGVRYYTTEDGEHAYPSVTAVLSSCEKSEKEWGCWRKRVGE